ncbi:MAG: hypothetical protein WC859_08975 [Elusimicrobiota bacterium]|jgi:hypothetical protein
MDKNRIVFVVGVLSLLGLFSRSSMACEYDIRMGDGCIIRFNDCAPETPPYYTYPNRCRTNPGHIASSQVVNEAGNYGFMDDTGGWVYYNDPADPRFGHIGVNCGHPDRKGKAWILD